MNRVYRYPVAIEYITAEDIRQALIEIACDQPCHIRIDYREQYPDGLAEWVWELTYTPSEHEFMSVFPFQLGQVYQIRDTPYELVVLSGDRSVGLRLQVTLRGSVIRRRTT